MFKIFESLRQRWADWCGDRDLEQSIRRHLSANGYYGGSAKLLNVRLAAVQRPGWLQVFRFDAIVKAAGDVNDGETETDIQEIEFRHLFGLVREDARQNMTTIRTFEDADDRRELFVQWSENLIQLRGGRGLD